MEIIMRVTEEEFNILINSDIEFFYDDEDEISFDNEEEYQRAREILKMRGGI